MATANTTDIDTTTSTGSEVPASSSSSAEKNDITPEQRQTSTTPTNTESEDEEDSNSSSSSSSSANIVDFVGRTVWVVASNAHLEYDPDRAFSHVMGVHSTKEKAIAEAKQCVRDHPPGDPNREEWSEDDPSHKEFVDAFLDGPANWKMVVDPFSVDKEMGYQYDTHGGLQEAVWIEEREVE